MYLDETLKVKLLAGDFFELPQYCPKLSVNSQYWDTPPSIGGHQEAKSVHV